MNYEFVLRAKRSAAVNSYNEEMANSMRKRPAVGTRIERYLLAVQEPLHPSSADRGRNEYAAL